MQSVLDRLSRRDAFSQDRESYLGKLASLFVTTDVDVRFGDLPAPADCHPEDGEFIVRIDQTDFKTLAKEQNITTEAAKPDSLSGVSNGYMDAFLQEGLLYHELGHVLFSDFDALSDVCSNVPMSERRVLKNLINAYEDAVIEIFLRQVYDCGQQLLIKNQVYHNLFHQDQDLWTDPATVEPISQANLVAFELGRVETGALDEFDSDAKEAGLDAFYDVIQMPNARNRYHRLMELFEEVKDDSDLRDAEDEMDDAQEGEADQSGRSDEAQGSAPDIDLSPDGDEDEEEEEEGSGQSQDEDEDEEAEDEESGSGSSGEDEDSEDETGSQSDEDSEDEDEIPSVGDVDSELDEEDVDDLVDETEVNPDEGDDEDTDQIRSEVNNGGVGDRLIEAPDPKELEEDPAVIKRAEQRSRYLQRVVEDHFEPTKGNAVNRDRTHGKFDSNRMVSAARGSPRCFKTEDSPEKPDFQVVIAVDASGSMSGDGMVEAAEAATMATKAFEDAGGAVYTYRFGMGCELVKTPSIPYDEAKTALSSTVTSASTDLLPILEQYPDLSQGVENSFLFVITDGQPGHIDGCMEQLRSIDDPTACLQYDEFGGGFGDDYDAFQVIKDSDDIQKKATSLIRRLVEQGGASL